MDGKRTAADTDPLILCDAGVMHVVVSPGAFLPCGLTQWASFDSHRWLRLILFRLVGVSHLEHQLS